MDLFPPSFFLSSPELKAQVSLSDQKLFVVRRRRCCCRCRRKLFFHIFIFYRITEPISTKLGTNHPWVKRTQVCSNEGPSPFPRGNN